MSYDMAEMRCIGLYSDTLLYDGQVPIRSFVKGEAEGVNLA